MTWDAAQLRILRELGHEPMRLAAAMGGRAEAGAAMAAPDSAPARSAAPSAATASQLAAAIARAAGGGDLSALALDLERLRREPALKRALWPRLRALRREH